MTWVHTPSHVCFCFELSPGRSCKIMHWCSGDIRAERMFPTAGGISHEGLFRDEVPGGQTGCCFSHPFKATPNIGGGP